VTTAEPCAHETVEASVEFTRLTLVEDGPVVGYQSSIHVACKGCKEPFEWIGLPVGLSPRLPMVSVDGLELRAPLRPVSSPPGFGEAGAGFTVAHYEAVDDGDEAP
jgi:hypothetical protein